jgi:DNA primase catalytic subunit
MLFLAKTLSFYKRKDIREELVRQAKDKEVAFRFDEAFGKRPEVLTYPNDVLELAKQRVTSFHCSEELWKNPLQLSSTLRKEELDALRKGWDLVLDIDCKFFEYSKIAAHYTVQALKQNGVKSITAKFSGNKGFHIAVPFEAFPKSVGGEDLIHLFPEAARRIALYITEIIRKPLADDIMKLEKNDFPSVMKKTGFSEEDIKRYELNEFGDKIPKLNVDPFLEIDTVLIAPRHLYRMPYSFHEKSQLISVPVDINTILSFEKEDAKPENVKVNHPFLVREVSHPDAETLLRNAFDFAPQRSGWNEMDDESPEKKYGKATYSLPEKAIGEENFPPCIKLILNGLEDGRKRGCFVLINFLISCGWDYELIEKMLLDWNEKNTEPLRPQYILGQLRYAKQYKKVLPPPNCNNLSYYKSFSICKPDDLCKQVKNPLQYAKRKDNANIRATKPMKKRKQDKD